jgi:hypothetical protein
MNHPNVKLTATAALVLASFNVAALPFNSFDPRSMAMGGAGVAVGDAATAPIYNPALLSTVDTKEKFSISLPIGVQISDQNKLGQSVNDFQNGNFVDNFNTASNNFNTTPTYAKLTQVQSSMTALSNQLSTLSDKTIAVDGGAALVIGVPKQHYGWAIYTNATASVGGTFYYKDASVVSAWNADANSIKNSCFDANGNLLTVLSAGACQTALNATTYIKLDTTNPASPTLTQTFDPKTQLNSTLNFRGAIIGEAGFSLSNQFDFGQGVALGITPKIVSATLIDYSQNINNASTNSNSVSGSDYTAKYNMFNLDLGAAKKYANGWRAGFVVKNLVPYTLDFKNRDVATGNQLNLKPLARVGGSWENTWSTVALDVDLTRNDPAGLGNASQFVALGGEVRIWKLMQLRAGYRADLANSSNSVASVGLGLGFLPIDIAVAGNQNQVAASMQLAMHF